MSLPFATPGKNWNVRSQNIYTSNLAKHIFQSNTNMDLPLWPSIPSLGRYIKSRLWKRWWEWHFTMRNGESQRSGRGSWMTIEIVGFLLSSFSFIRYLFIPSGITYPIHSSVLKTAKTEQKWTEYDYFVANSASWGSERHRIQKFESPQCKLSDLLNF